MGWGDFTSSFWSGTESLGKAAVDVATLQYGDALDNWGESIAHYEAGISGQRLTPPPPPPEAPVFGAFDLSDPFSTEGEFSKGVKRAKGSSELSKEQLLASFVDKNSITAGDFSRGSGVAF